MTQFSSCFDHKRLALGLLQVVRKCAKRILAIRRSHTQRLIYLQAAVRNNQLLDYQTVNYDCITWIRFEARLEISGERSHKYMSLLCSDTERWKVVSRNRIWIWGPKFFQLIVVMVYPCTLNDNQMKVVIQWRIRPKVDWIEDWPWEHETVV